MADAPFVHLHCHSHYSLLDGASRIPDLVNTAKEQGMNALALTDHGNLHGALQFYQAAKEAEINPIVGYEAYIAPGSRFEKDSGNKKESAYHLTLLAQNRTGFKNLMKMASAAFLEGFYFKPRIDRELLKDHSEGIVCLSGCVSGELSRAILARENPDIAELEKIASWFHDVFGERYYLEIQNNGLEIQRLAMEGTVDLANRMGLPLVATSDAHYVRQGDAEAQDILLCINTGKYRTDTNRMKMEGSEFYLRGPAAMYESFPDHADAVRRSQEIADAVDLELDLGKRFFPSYDLPEGKSSDGYLRELCIAGLCDRYQGKESYWDGEDLSREVMDRLDRELGVIERLDFPNYFLIVWDFVRYARERNIPNTARGSGVGSLVCYALYLSHVCPLKHDLLFERFLDESRREAPDIDIDFCRDRRGDVIQYVKDEYGEANVAQIGTFGTLAARAAIRDVGRALGMPIFRVDQVVAMVPDSLGIKLKNAIEESAELKAAYEGDAEVRELLDLAQKIEGLARNVGTHAAAVVISDKPLTEYVPLGRVAGKSDIITQWSMNDVENAGLLKMDFLGLRNLTILAKTIDLIEETTGERIDPHKFPLDDEATYALLCRGETKGIFQLESGGIRDLLQRMKPDCFDDIIATAALYRPGPLEGGMVDTYIEVKHGRQQPVYPHPVMEEVLHDTHGVMVYQEQVMRILNRLGGIPLADAYSCIKAISKKKLPMIAKFKEEFYKGATDSGLDKKKAEELFAMIEKFAGYGFNKSHSTAYALIAYQTAYLKCHHPVEFMAALLCSDISGRNFKRKDSLVEHMEDCQRMNIEIIPPDVNHSHAEFTVVDGKISFGLTAVKGCGIPAAEAIKKSRASEGRFTDLFDFCSRIDPSQVNRSTIETLVKAGAFDSFGAKRSQIMAVVDRAMTAGAGALADRRSGQMNMFDMEDEDGEQDTSADLPNLPEWSEKEKLPFEKEVLGFYLSSHPLAEFAETLKTFCSHSSTQLADLKHRDEVLVGGMLAAIKFSNTKKPKPGSTHTKYAMWDLEDLDGIVRCILWPEQFAQYGELVAPDAIVAIRAAVDRRPGADEVNLICNELIPIEVLPQQMTSGLRIRVDEETHGVRGLEQLYEILRGYPGKCDLKLVLDLSDGQRVTMQSGNLRVHLNEEMRGRVDQLLGPGNVKLAPSKRNGGASRADNRRNPAPVGA